MTTKISVIGLGIMGRRMLDNLVVHPEFEPVAVWDPSEEAQAKTRAEFPAVPQVGSAEAAIAAADAVYLACPPAPRKAYALSASASEQGKGVFLEKPLGVDIEESRDLVAKLAAAGTRSAVNFTQAAGRALTEVKRAFDAGEMGAIKGIDIVVTYPAWPRAWQVEADWLRFRAEGGYTREVISHFVFLSERLLGRTKIVSAHASYPSDPALCETLVLARLENEAGVPVNILGSVGGVQPDRQEVTVTAEKMSYRVAEFFQLSKSDGGPWEQAIEPPSDHRRETLQRQLTEFAKCLRGEAHVLATADDALSVQEKIEGILASE